MPALLGGLLAKRVYSYPSATSGTSSGQTDYYYAYDAIGNVIAIADSNGARQYHFTQDAFGNELTQDSFAGDSWTTAQASGLWEHQTGKWLDPETGLYFLHARWVDPEAGRFVGRTGLPRFVEEGYVYCQNVPSRRFDLDGNQSWEVAPPSFDLPERPGKPPKWGNLAVCIVKCMLRAIKGGKSPLGIEAQICFHTECTEPDYVPEPNPVPDPIYQKCPYPYPSGKLPEPLRCTHGPYPDGTFQCQLPALPRFPDFEPPNWPTPPDGPIPWWLIFLFLLPPVGAPG